MSSESESDDKPIEAIKRMLEGMAPERRAAFVSTEHIEMYRLVSKHTEDGVAVVLVGATMVELQLRSLLVQTAPTDVSRNLDNKLFGNRAPLQHLGAKADLARFMGLLDNPLYASIRALRDLRNQLAHPTRDGSVRFHLEDHKDKVQKLWSIVPSLKGFARMSPDPAVELIQQVGTAVTSICRTLLFKRVELVGEYIPPRPPQARPEKRDRLLPVHVEHAIARSVDVLLSASENEDTDTAADWVTSRTAELRNIVELIRSRQRTGNDLQQSLEELGYIEQELNSMMLFAAPIEAVFPSIQSALETTFDLREKLEIDAE